MMRLAKIKKIAARVAVGALALVSLLSMAASTRAQDAERPYPTMLPLSQYLMDPGCGNRAGAKRCSGGHFKGCVCFGADAQRLGNGGPRYERFCVHGGAVMDGQH